MADTPLFMTQRAKVIEAYKQANQPFNASTKPYKSTVGFGFTNIVNVTLAQVTWMVAAAGQSYDWFGYKINDTVPGATSAYRVANEADTNLSKARTTNGAEDFVIEGMSASCRSLRYAMSIPFDADLGVGNTGPVVNSLSALGPIYDPAALYVPPQAQSPLNLEMGLFRHLAPYISIEFEWDRRRIEKIGTLEQLPEGAANSYLRASGEPSTNDRYRIPEGYIWRREGEPDSEFITRGTLQDPLCVPVFQLVPPAINTAVQSNPPYQMFLDVVMRLHGLSVKLPTRN